MSQEITAAVVQMNSGLDKPANFAAAERLVRAAAGQGATLVVLPEYFNCLGDRRTMLAEAEPLDGPTARFLRELATAAGVTLVGGTFCERTADGTRAHNTCLTFDPSGRHVSTYRKLHLFDVDLPGKVTYCETSWLAAGNDVVVCDVAGFRTALAVCYDVRFPELFRLFADRGAEVVAFPSAFTKQTGRDHWELLLRARAVENQCYVVAANQTGRHAALETYGHSLIVDPWGAVLCDAGEAEGFVTATLSSARVAEVRAQLPALQHRRALTAAPQPVRE